MVVTQNSESKISRSDGIGRIVKKQALRKLYWIEVEGVKLKAGRSTPRRRRRQRHHC
jgi:hypothetical protein